MKRVIVFGATGNLGAHISLHLKEKGYDCDLRVVESVEILWIEPRISTKKTMKDIIVEVKR